MKKDELEIQSDTCEKQNIMKTPIKEEVKHSFLDCITPLKQEGFRLDNSVLNSIAHTPLKITMDENKQFVPPYSMFKDQAAKFINMPQLMQMNLNTKDNNLRGFNDTFDSQQIYEDYFGKKRLRSSSSLILPPGSIIPESGLMNSIICSPSKVRRVIDYSHESSHETPHLYEKEEEVKEAYYHPTKARRNLMDQYGKEGESESENEEVEDNPGIRTARSERGLKRLSVKVRDLVFKLKETSYKDVANRLIEELVVDNEFDESGRRLDK